MIWMHVVIWGEVGEKCPKLSANETLYQLSYNPKADAPTGSVHRVTYIMCCRCDPAS